MNIFVLDLNPTRAAGMLFDTHVRSQALETAQILSTVNGGPYKPTHAHHPCVLWAGAFLGNYNWLIEHGLAICDEFARRFGKTHACRQVVEYVEKPMVHIPHGFSPFEQCMPEEFRGEDPVEAYRRYYRSKAHLAGWTGMEPPEWWGDLCN